MGIKTEDMVMNLPPKEITEGIDWLAILDSFDPTSLKEKYVNECARRNPYDTCYKWDTPSRPIEERLHSSEFGIKLDRQALEEYVNRIKTEGLNASLYKNARMTLIKAIGSIGAHEYNLREYSALGEDGRKKQAENYKRYEAECERKIAERNDIFEEPYYGDYVASMHEKVIRIRKGFKDSSGRPLTQRDFAKFLEYPINKYQEAEKIGKWYRDADESPVDEELLERLVFRCHANPYWLYDSECEASFGEESQNAQIVLEGDEPCIYASPDVILHWIKNGKPRNTYWTDGVDIEEVHS